MNNIIINNHIFMLMIDNGQIYLLLKKDANKLLVPKYKYEGKGTLENSINSYITKNTNIKGINYKECHIYSKNNIVDIVFTGFTTKEQTKYINPNYDFYSIYEIDNKLICKEVLEYLKSNLINLNVIKKLIPEYFSLKELQDLYENLLEIKIDRRNFRKRLMNMNIVLETDNYKKKDSNGRPNKLYKFNNIENVRLI